MLLAELPLKLDAFLVEAVKRLSVQGDAGQLNTFSTSTVRAQIYRKIIHYLEAADGCCRMHYCTAGQEGAYMTLRCVNVQLLTAAESVTGCQVKL